MGRLTRDGTAQLVSRDQILWRERGQVISIFFPVQLTTRRIGNLTRSTHTPLHVMTVHTYHLVRIGLKNEVLTIEMFNQTLHFQDDRDFFTLLWRHHKCLNYGRTRAFAAS